MEKKKKEFVKVCPHCFSENIKQSIALRNTWHCLECNFDYFAPLELEKGFDKKKLLKKIKSSDKKKK